MGQKSGTAKASAERVVKDIRRKTRRKSSAQEKVRMVLKGLRGEIKSRQGGFSPFPSRSAL